MSKVSRTISAGDNSSDSECSYVTAFEEIPDLTSVGVSAIDLCVSGPKQTSCCGACKVDAKTQTSNCKFCRLSVYLGKLTEEISSQESFSHDENSSPDASSISSLTTVTPSNESDFGSEDSSESCVTEAAKRDSNTFETQRQPQLKHPTVSNVDRAQEVSVNSKDGPTGYKQASMSTHPQHEKVREIDNRFTNRSINSVARIIVADSVDKVKADDGIHQYQQTKEIRCSGQPEEIMWRNNSGHNGVAQHPATNSAHLLEEDHTPVRIQHDHQHETTSRSVWRMPDDTSEATLIQHAIWTMENLHEMWSQGTLCDVLLSTSSGKEFPVHRLVLSLHSGFFKQILSDSNSENRGFWKITLSDSIRDKTVESILRFMYTSLVQINNDTISDMLQASVDLSIHRLTRLCIEFIDHITVDNCLRILNIAEKNSLTEHVSKTKNFINVNFIAISKTEAFLNFPIERIQPLLTEDTLNVDSEIDVFLAAKRWSQRNQDADMTSAALVMSAIRFQLFSPEELAKHVESVNWLMEIPEVRVQVLEAFRYLSLAASYEERLRPSPPRRRGLGKTVPISRNHEQPDRYDSSVPVRRDVSTAMSRSEGIEQQTSSDFRSKHNIATSMSGKFVSSNELVSPRSKQHRESNTNTSIDTGRKLRESSTRMVHESATQLAAQPQRQAESVSRNELIEPMNSLQTSGSVSRQDSTSKHGLESSSRFESVQFREQPKASKTMVTSMPGKLSFKTSNIGQKSKNILKKPLSDYRITTANPKALKRGPQAWPTPKNLIPSGTEDGTSDLIVVSGGVSTTGDVDRPGKVIEVYDPQREQWRDSIGAPVARNHHVVVFLQDSIYLIGGSDPHGKGSEFIKPVNTVYRYDLRLAKWTKATGMMSTRIFHQASALMGQLYVVGGQDHKGRTLSSVETYTPITDSWRQVAPISTPRYAVAMTTYGQRLWVAGGYCEESGSEMVNTVEYFNPYSEEWTPVTPMRSARCHANLLPAGGRLYLIGGYVTGHHGVEKHSTIDVYDEDEKKWTFVTEMEHGRHDGKTIAWHDKIFVFGARSDDDEERPLTRVDYFDTKEKVWKIHSTDLTSARFGHACCIIPAKSATNWL